MLILSHLLRRAIKRGRLTVIGPRGEQASFGSGVDGPAVTVRLHDAKIGRELFFNPELAVAEGYMDGRITFENGSTLHDLLWLFWLQRSNLRGHPLQRAIRNIRRRFRRWQMHNPVGITARNARHHYDIPSSFYRLWLDSSMTYTCAYWRTPDVGLEQAQRDKIRHVAAKLNLIPGMKVLEIGSGWGELAIYLARFCGVQVTGLNLSPEQIAVAQQRVAEAGVVDKVTFLEKDYREISGTFDRIVSVGMMEAVGVANFDEYFGAIKNLLTPDGFALVHCIGRMEPPGYTGPFFQKYIFPGGYAPALSEVFESVQRVGLWSSDCEFLRLHYYWTIKAWRERFMARRTEVVAMMGERFARMWEFYLTAVEISFLVGADLVFQLLVGKTRDAVPVIRDYMVDDERRLAKADV